jgi:hypothetical protein
MQSIGNQNDSIYTSSITRHEGSELYRSKPRPATTAPRSDDPARTVPAALFVGVGEAVATAPETAADLDTALPLLEFVVEAAVTIPVGAPAVEAATMIPPAAVAAVGATVVEAFPEGEACKSSIAWMMLKVSMPPPK